MEGGGQALGGSPVLSSPHTHTPSSLFYPPGYVEPDWTDRPGWTDRQSAGFLPHLHHVPAVGQGHAAACVAG